MKLLSSTFENGGLIPQIYTCDGQNISPPLSWENAPANTKSFVLIVDDPDAPVGTWDHWLLFNIPSTVNSLAENFNSSAAGISLGRNSWGNSSYGGPCPPDKMHRYFFKLYALDVMLDLKPGATKQAIETAMLNHILATAELMGKYDRQRRSYS